MAINDLKNWIKNNKVDFFLLVLILLVASFFRFYKIDEGFNFMGDTGRDAQEAYKIIIDHKLTLIGPRASVAGFFMGPFYFYLITLPLFLFKMNPIALAYFASLSGVVAVFLIFLLSRELFSSKISLFVAFLYGVSNIVIIYSRTSWNPSPVPIFTILSIFALIRYLKSKSGKRYLAMWLFAAIGGQLHYTFYYLIAALSIILLIYQHDLKTWAKGMVKGGIILLLVNSSLIFFDIRHNFITSKAFAEFIFGNEVGINFSTYLFNYFQNLRYLFDLTFVQGFYPVIKTFLILILIIFSALRRKKDFLLIFAGLLLISLLFFSAFKETLQFYYFNFLLPIPFILIGYIFLNINKKQLSTFLMLLISLLFLNYNLPSNLNPPRPNKSLKQIQAITESIVKRVPPNTSFNVALFSQEPWYSAEEYRYYTYYLGRRAKGADDYRNIDNLYVIVFGEMENPLAIRSQETDDFGPKIIKDKWETESAKIYMLGK